jgi:integrase
MGDLSVQAIDTGLVLKVIEPIWAKKLETAGRVRGRIEAILDWAKIRNYRTGENPARWDGHLENALPSRKELRKIRPVKHHPALPYQELGAFMIELQKRQGVAVGALEFLILTAGRTGEVIGARWQEIELESRVVVKAESGLRKGEFGQFQGRA